MKDSLQLNDKHSSSPFIKNMFSGRFALGYVHEPSILQLPIFYEQFLTSSHIGF